VSSRLLESQLVIKLTQITSGALFNNEEQLEDDDQLKESEERLQRKQRDQGPAPVTRKKAKLEKRKRINLQRSRRNNQQSGRSP
jgi:hypothetical protein